MGIPLACAKLLVVEHERAPFGGTVLQLGRQRCSFTAREIEGFARRRGVSLAPAPALADEGGVGGGWLDDRAFFTMLGFSEVRSCDVSAFEGADILHDLNTPAPPEVVGRFDLVFNGGTLEHVFHLPNALANVHAMVRTGGRVVHVAPTSNQIDHGFYSLSPTFFEDYYRANGWAVCASYVVAFSDWEAPWDVYTYAPGAMDGMIGRFDGARSAGVFFVAEKTPSARCDVIPQQGAYVSRWKVADADAPPRERPVVPRTLSRVRRELSLRAPRLGRAADALGHALAWPGRIFGRAALPPKVGRF